MLTTLYKDKLPRGFSYPAGTALVSSYMENECRVRGITGISFWLQQIPRRYAARPESLLVASLRFSNLDFPYVTKRGSNSQSWSLDIYGIYSECRASVRDAMCGSGFDMLASWLRVERSETWFLTDHRLSIYFYPDGELLKGEVAE